MRKTTHHNDYREFEVKKSKSSLADFVEHDMPSEKELDNFESYTAHQMHTQYNSDNVDGSLLEIYQDGNGDLVNVRKIDMIKRRGWKFWVLMVAMLFGFLWGASYIVGHYFSFSRTDNATSLTISGKGEVLAGEEFFYQIEYKNLNSIILKNTEIQVNYPDNFLVIESEPQAGANNIFKIGDIGAHRSGSIRIKGKLIGTKKKNNITFATMTYTPENFSSEFKKDASIETVISDIGVNLDITAPTSVMAGETNDLTIKYSSQVENYLNNFRITATASDNIEFLSATTTATSTADKPWIINVADVGTDEKTVSFKFKSKEKNNPQENINIKFEYSDDGVNYYSFLEQVETFEVVKNDLNLNLVINGSRDNAGIDAGQTLNYSIIYTNKGEAEMKDIVVMAVLDSDVLDWSSLNFKTKGKVIGNTITWTKDDVPALADLKTNDEGTIDFSISTLPLDKIKTFVFNAAGVKKKMDISSYAQFSIGNIKVRDEDSRSNLVVTKINSDLDLKEEVRYFSSDNIAVGSGPLPPKVGQTTSYKVYWHLSNNLHELDNLAVSVQLPDYVTWNEKNNTSIGSIDYNSDQKKVVWNIGRLPVSALEATAEFSISITPTVNDVDKILVLLPGSEVVAVDTETKAQIKYTAKAKTTKLEDDDIANSDGRITQ